MTSEGDPQFHSMARVYYGAGKLGNHTIDHFVQLKFLTVAIAITIHYSSN